MTDKQIIIDGFNLEYIKELLYNGQRSAITTKIFEEIIEKLERKEQECEELNANNISLRDRVGKLERAILRRNEQIDQLEETNEDLLSIQYKLADSNLKSRQTITEIKEIINEFAKEDILTFPDFSKEKNYELIQKQCGEPILKILQKINEVENAL